MQRLVLLANARPLVAEADRVAAVKDGDSRLDERGMNEVFDKLANDGEGNRATLLARELGDFLRDLCQEVSHVARFDYDDSRRYRRVVVNGDPGGIDNAFLRVFATLGVAGLVVLLDERIEVPWHPKSSLSRISTIFHKLSKISRISFNRKKVFNTL